MARDMVPVRWFVSQGFVNFEQLSAGNFQQRNFQLATFDVHDVTDSTHSWVVKKVIALETNTCGATILPLVRC